jgi:UDP-N-acetylmuramyl pentapeptide phosphotransferase/UDP-N-acetylglucosamine-1-phosphate transferase
VVLIALEFSIGAGLVWLLCFPVQSELSRRRLIDHPNGRSNHVNPTPRGGGVAILAVVIVGFVAIGLFKTQTLPLILAGAALGLAAISLVDDYKPLPARVRFAAHSLAALLVLLWVIRAGNGKNAVDFPHFNWALPVLFLWIVGYTNAFNFMDGINGIAAGQASATAIGSVLLVGLDSGRWREPSEMCAVLIAGAAVGFLPHNFPRARMFMGDVGSAPIGFLLAAIALWFAAEFGWYLLPPLVLLHANYVLDTSITMGRRFLRGDRIYEAHREHFYQRLVRSGKSHFYTTALEMALQAVTLALCLLYLRANGNLLRGGVVAAILLVWVGFFTYAEWTFRLAPGSRKSSAERANVLQQLGIEPITGSERS